MNGQIKAKNVSVRNNCVIYNSHCCILRASVMHTYIAWIAVAVCSGLNCMYIHTYCSIMYMVILSNGMYVLLSLVGIHI